MIELSNRTIGVEAIGSPTQERLRIAGIAVAGTLFVAICAHISIPLLFSPVPLTMQPFAVLLLALILGPRVAFLTLSLYLAEGAAGFPVFTPTGVGGILQLFGPTGGYLLSYPFVAIAVSWLARTEKPGFPTRVRSAAIGSALILLSGALWLALFTHVSLKMTLNAAILPFLPGDTLKVIAAAAIATGWLKIRERQSRA